MQNTIKKVMIEKNTNIGMKKTHKNKIPKTYIGQIDEARTVYIKS